MKQLKEVKTKSYQYWIWSNEKPYSQEKKAVRSVLLGHQRSGDIRDFDYEYIGEQKQWWVEIEALNKKIADKVEKEVKKRLKEEEIANGDTTDKEEG